MTLRTLLLVLSATALILIAGSALADTAVLDALKDNTLCENAMGTLSNGAGDHFFAGRTASALRGGPLRRGIISFDIAAGIPAGTTIDSVTLELYLSKSSRAGTEMVSLHKGLTGWGEGDSDAADEEGRCADSEPGDATWLHSRFSTDLGEIELTNK